VNGIIRYIAAQDLQLSEANSTQLILRLSTQIPHIIN